jgi:hypothetical protein
MNIATALSGLPPELARGLEHEMAGLFQRFARGDWSPSELNGARLAEVALRYVEWKRTSHFTPFNRQLGRKAICAEALQDTSQDDSVRMHIPHAAELVMDIRNKRDVAHLATVVDVNEMDSQVVLRLASWIVAEIVRLEAGLGHKEIQALIDSLTVKSIPLVEVFDGDAIVVAPHLSATERALVGLYHSYPDPCAVSSLRASVKYANATRFRILLEALEKKGFVHIKADQAYLTRLGVDAVESLLR